MDYMSTMMLRHKCPILPNESFPVNPIPPLVTLQVQVSSAEADRRQLLEAFTIERAKREAEAMAARRALESRLADTVRRGQGA